MQLKNKLDCGLKCTKHEKNGIPSDVIKKMCQQI